MTTRAARTFRRLQGLFCVYKPPGVHWKLVRDTVETNLLKGINASPPVALPQRVHFIASTCPSKEAGGPTGVTMRAESVPVLAKHPLVTGPEFLNIRVGVGHCLDVSSSGIMVLGIGKGNQTLNELYQSRMSRDYTLECEFGIGTRDHSHLGRVVERTTYDHITIDKLEKVLVMLEGVNQKILKMYTKVDMNSQEAYDMAVQGLLGPEGKSSPILTGLRCVHFQPPNFTLEVQCLNETQQYLRKVVHEVGLELRSTAVCKSVRRTRDGFFTLQDALIRHHWTVEEITRAVQRHRDSQKSQKRSQSGRAAVQTRQDSGTIAHPNRIEEELAGPEKPNTDSRSL